MIVALILLLSSPSLLPPQTEVPSQVRSQVEAAIARSGAEVAVAYRTLDGHRELLIHPDQVFHAASTMKVAVMVELFRQAAEGRFKLSDEMPVRNEFKSIVDGSPYSIEPEADGEVYEHLGGQLSLSFLCRQMITVSSNLATNLLIEKLGPENIQGTVDRLGAGGLKVLRGVEDIKAYEKGLSNSTTARALLILLEKIARLEAVDEASSVEMISILRDQQFRDAIPAGLPADIGVAHKTGEITEIHHDAGIVYGERPFILVVLVRGISEREESAALIAEIASILYQSAIDRR